MSFVINLFGDSIRYWKCTISDEQFTAFKKIKDKHNVDWEILLLNFDFLKHFGYAHWSELSDQREEKVFLLNSINKIEIKEKNKILLKINSDKILNNNSLFELYNTELSSFENTNLPTGKSFIIAQKEIGMFGKYELDNNTFDIDKLTFHVFSNKNIFKIEALYSLVYDNIELIIKKEDTIACSYHIDWLN
jgi:hypothetical protein